MYSNEYFDGYRFSWFSKEYAWIDQWCNEGPIRWHTIFNFTLLRMLSFAFDKHWQHYQIKIELPGKITKKNKHTLRGRQDTFRPKEEYNW